MGKELGSNDAVFLDTIFDGVDELFTERAGIDPQSFLNLCSIVESAVLHNQLWLVGQPSSSTLAKYLREKHILNEAKTETSSNIDLINLQLNRLLHLTDSSALNRITWERDNQFTEKIVDWLDFVSASIEGGVLWWLDAEKYPAAKSMWRILQFLNEHAAPFTRKHGVPLYPDVMWVPFTASYSQQYSIPVDLYKKLAVCTGSKWSVYTLTWE